ncbi:MAG: O-antigen ligase family protein [Hyphomonadaceae bacterium]
MERRDLRSFQTPMEQLAVLMRRADPYALAAWVVLTTFVFELIPGLAPLAPLAGPARYLVVLYMAAGVVLNISVIWPTLMRSWPVFVLPALALASALWNANPSASVNKFVLMIATILVGAYIATRYRPKNIILTYFFVELVAGVLCVMNPNFGETNQGAATGVFGHKNYFALHMFFLYLSALVLALDRRSSMPMRLLAFGATGMAAYLILISQSATTLAFVAASSSGLLFYSFVWKPASGVPHMRSLIVVFGLMLTLLAIFILIAILHIDLYGSMLDVLGKDRTLSARTYIWAYGERVLSDNPWTGVGPGGFWNPQNGDAVSLQTTLGYKKWVQLTFHNAYLEYGVQFGYPGYFATIFFVFWAIYAAARSWFRDQSIYNAYFLFFVMLIAVRTNTETDICSDFGGSLVTLLAGAMRGMRPMQDAVAIDGPDSLWRQPPDR